MEQARGVDKPILLDDPKICCSSHPCYIGLQTIVLKKDIFIQCSLLSAPPLLFSGRLDARPEVDTDSETDEVLAEVEDSDTEYVTDTVER